MRRILLIANIAFQTLRANPLHTFLSTIGLVVGVAALVAILSLGDGLEKYARNQISTTTSLEGISVSPRTKERVDGVNLDRESIAYLQVRDADALAALIKNEADLTLSNPINARIMLPGDTARSGIYMEATMSSAFDVYRHEFAAGRAFTRTEMETNEPVVVLAYSVASRLAGEQDSVDVMLGRIVLIDEQEAEVIGVMKGAVDGDPLVLGPIDYWIKALGGEAPSRLLVRAKDVAQVPLLKAQITNWLDNNVDAGSAGFSIATNQMRVEQVRQGIRVFKLVMGFITGISVLVGGIGVMNVLLIAITERTREIGIRKATGAQKKDIVFQFLTESVTISLVGSVFGLLLGLATLLVAIPIIKNMAEVPFEMAFSTGSLGVIFVVAIVVGIGFGTYPAWRAANLSPVDAIRHE
ncbi:MAG: ABC transporter permease [Bacteroidota bacterium]